MQFKMCNTTFYFVTLWKLWRLRSYHDIDGEMCMKFCQSFKSQVSLRLYHSSDMRMSFYKGILRMYVSKKMTKPFLYLRRIVRTRFVRLNWNNWWYDIIPCWLSIYLPDKNCDTCINLPLKHAKPIQIVSTCKWNYELRARFLSVHTELLVVNVIMSSWWLVVTLRV